MYIQPGILRYNNNEVHCLRMGEGSRLIIAFHGFGHDASVFSTFAHSLPDEYTLIAVDLPGHGKTRWLDKLMSKKDLMAIVQGIKNNFSVERFSLLGYSLGGRICLNIAEQHPAWVDKIVLLAPDGMQKNFWYHFATRNPVGRVLFRSLLNNPEKWVKKIGALKNWKLIDESRFKFIRHHLLDTSAQKQLAYVWPLTRKLIAHPDIVRWNIKKHKIQIDVFMGKHDRIFTVIQGERFVRRLKNARLHVLECGHNLLVNENYPSIARVFSS